MIIAVHVEEHEALVIGRNAIEQVAEHPVVSGMDGERSIDEIRVRQAVPDIKAPALLRRAIDGLAGCTVEIEFEARR